MTIQMNFKHKVYPVNQSILARDRTGYGHNNRKIDYPNKN